jgi:hypothetical protein
MTKIQFNCLQVALEHLFYKHGKFLAKHPLPYMLIPIIFTLLSALGFLRFEQNSDTEYLYTPIDGESKLHRQIFNETFTENQTDRFIATRKLKSDGFVLVLLRSYIKDENIFTPAYFQEILRFDENLRNTNFTKAGSTYKYQDVCAKWINYCSPNLFLDIFNHSSDNLAYIPLGYPVFNSRYFIGETLAGVVLSNGTVTSFKALMLSYFVKYQTQAEITEGNKWLSSVKEHILATKSNYSLSIKFATSLSLGETLQQNVLDMSPNLSIASILLLLFCILSCLMTDAVASKPFVAMAGELSAGMAIVASIGLLTGLGVTFSDSTSMMPFLIIGKFVKMLFI